MKAYFTASPVANSVPFDNSTNGFTSSSTQTAIEEARTTVLYSIATATSNTSTSSTTDSIISGMTLTPVAGTYLVFYNGSISTSGANNSGEISLYNGNTRITESVKDVSINVALLLGVIGTSTIQIGANATFAVTVANGTNAITAQFKSTSGSNAITIGQRSLIVLRIL